MPAPMTNAELIAWIQANPPTIEGSAHLGNYTMASPWANNQAQTQTAQAQVGQQLPADFVIFDDLPDEQEATMPTFDLDTPIKITRRGAPKPAPSPTSKMGDLYSYRQLSYNKADCTKFEKSYKLQTEPFKWSTEEGMVGIEVEVENITHSYLLPPHWSAKDDGSLRNHGVEFVSVPLQIKQVQIAVEALYQSLHSNNQPDFSNRTSIHVHLNCRDLTQDQIYVLVLLYSIFEKHFYGFAGTKRLNSIFCVPIYRCNILKQAIDVIYGFNPSWHKYCGLNILPLIDNNGQRGYGTIEFRHLYGTSDTKAILTWVDQILCLRKACTEIKKEELLEQIKTMNTTSDYLALYYRIFTIPAQVRDKQMFEECISNIKRELFAFEYEQTLRKDNTSTYWALAQKLGLKG